MRYSPDRPACHPSRVAAPADSAEPGVTRSRLESLSDGVMAVAITLLVLGIDAPTPAPGQSLWDALDADAVFSLALFAISFAIIARFWLVHHDAVRDLPATVPYRIVTLNFAFLLMVCLVPFATTLYGRNNDDMLALIIYASAFAIMSVLLRTIRSGGRVEPRLVSLYIPAVFLLAIPVAVVVGPAWATLTWLIIVLVSDERVEALTRRRSA